MALTAVGAASAKAVARQPHDATFVTCFIAILTIALVSRSLLLNWRTWFPGAEGEKSLLGGVRAAVDSIMSLL